MNTTPSNDVALIGIDLGKHCFHLHGQVGVVCGRGAESYAKDFGQRYSPVRLMCSHPSGETWARRSVDSSFPSRF